MTGNPAIVSILVLYGSLGAYADTLRLKTGGAVQGTLISANSSEVRFESASGSSRTYRVGDIDGIDFAPLPPPAPAETAAAPNASRAEGMESVVVPAGTDITVRMIDSIQGEEIGAGRRYNCSVADPVAIGDQVVIPRGANCTVQVVAVESGKELSLSLYDISVQGRSFATASEPAVVQAQGTSKGKKAARRGVGLGALGAGIGAIAGGGTGAAIGAVVGGGVGATSGAVAKGKKLSVPSETRLSFKLRTPLPLS